MPDTYRGGNVRIYAWIVLLAIPFVFLGWTLGHVGPVLDDWFIWNAVNAHQWLALDSVRPIAMYPMALLHFFAGNNLVAIYAGLLLVHGISAVFLYEVARRLFRLIAPRDAEYLALLVAVVFVIYPSDVSRFWLLASFGARWVCISACAAALFWIAAFERNDARWVAGALIVAAAAVLRAESDLVLFLTMPLLGLFYGRQVRRGGFAAALAVWYGAIAAYLYWHFVIARPQWSFGRFGNAVVDIRPLNAHNPLGLVTSGLYNLGLMTFGTLDVDLARWGVLALLAILAGAAIAAGAWFFAYRRSDMRRPPISRSAWLYSLLVCAAFAFAGLLPFMLNGADENRVTQITGIESRFTAIATMGVSGLIVCFALLPIGRVSRRLDRRVNLIAAAILSAVVLSVGAVRQVREAHDYTTAWSIQKREWYAILERQGYWQMGSTILYSEFPDYVRQAPMANQSWAVKNGLQMFLSPPPAASMFVTNDPADLRLFPDNAGETYEWRLEGARLTAKWFPLKERLSIPIETFVVLRYDSKSDTIAPATIFPPQDLDSTKRAVPLYTGPNRMMPQRTITQLAAQWLGPHARPKVCSTIVAVTTDDAAPQNGAAAIVDGSGSVVDRRYIMRGERLNYSLYARCGTHLTVHFEPSDPGTLTDRSPLGRTMPAKQPNYLTGEGDASLPYQSTFR